MHRMEGGREPGKGQAAPRRGREESSPGQQIMGSAWLNQEPQSICGLGVDGAHGTLASGLRGSGEFAAGLVIVVEAELADHAIEVGGK